MLDGQEDPDLDPRGTTRRSGWASGWRASGFGDLREPARRTAQTAAPLLRRTGLQPRVLDSLREVSARRVGGRGLAARGGRPGHHRRALGRLSRRGDQRVARRPRPSTLHGSRGAPRPAGRGVHPRRRHRRRAAARHRQPPLRLRRSGQRLVSHLVLLGERWLLRRYNDTAHLATDLDDPRAAPATRRAAAGAIAAVRWPGGHQCAARTSTRSPRIGVPSPRGARAATSCPAAAARRR